MNQSLETLAAAIDERFENITRIPSTCGELTYEIPASESHEIFAALRDEDAFSFEQLIDIAGVDYLAYRQVEWTAEKATGQGFSRGATRLAPQRHPGAPRRFCVVYHLMSLRYNRRLRLKVYCPDDDYPVVSSVTDLWPAADWFEREAFDLYGVLFEGHPDLRRILTDYGFIGHPFRKDFPLSGNVEMRYDPEQRRVIYEPVSIEPRVLVPRVIRHGNQNQPDLYEKPVGYES